MSAKNDKEKPAIPEHLRLRFCPSPTGIPHVGMIHTALYNWAEARHAGGTLIFRMEDTDDRRDTQESLDMIIEALNWMGIDWDEGIGKGNDDLYFQSRRKGVYQGVAEQLFEAGFAYESFSTAEEIAERNKAAGRPETFGYDGYDRNLTEEQKEAFRKEGRKPALRIRVPNKDISWDDLVRGPITYKAGSFPDFVIVRPNGDPLYTLTNPVDDAILDVNMVLRGEDLLPSTPRQIVLYEYLKKLGIAKQTPLFGHLPYVMGEGNKKLSKRDPQSNLFLLRDMGFTREGLLNYLSLLGWSYSSDQDVFSMEELVKKFDVRDVKANPARFDLKKAISINASHIRMLETEDFASRCVPYLFKEGLVSGDKWENLAADEKALLLRISPLVQPRVRLLSEAVPMMLPLIDRAGELQFEKGALEPLTLSDKEILDRTLKELENVQEEDWKADTLHTILTDCLINDMSLSAKKAFNPVRLAISGKKVSAPLFESLEIIGKPVVIERISSLRSKI